MKVVRWMTAVAGIASVLSVQAPDRALSAVGDAEVILYRFPGVFDDGAIFTGGVATAFHCSNFSGVSESIRIVIRDQNAGVVANFATTLPHLRTIAFTTHSTSIYAAFNLSTGAISQGTAALAATSTSLVCTAMTVDAASLSPVGIALHGIRFNPVPGTQE